MILKFLNSKGVLRVVKENISNEEEAFLEINKFCSERNFKIYYIRKWKEDNVTTFDVGSHTEFFKLYD